MGGLSTAEKNRRKRERKKKDRQRERDLASKGAKEEEEEVPQAVAEEDIEIEYVAEELPDSASADALEVLLRFQARAAAAVAIEAEDEESENNISGSFNNSTTAENALLSKRKLRDTLRPSIAQLKRKVARPDLVEAHDVAATDPEFLLRLKAVPGSVPVPRHWGRKRKYLQGKRGFEKPPFRLPQFIIDTGIAELRDAVNQSDEDQSAKQKNRARVTPKLGAIDVDYRTLHDAFFKHQTKPTNLTKFGDIYYEGRETEVGLQHLKPGRPLSTQLREALGTAASAPPPWLWNMQRYGPPPSWPGLAIPGLTAPLPDPSCQYGFHPTGWGQPPMDPYGRPLYGGNPMDPPGSLAAGSSSGNALVTSDGKTIAKEPWGALPGVEEESNEAEEEESSSEEEEDMEESEEEGEEEEVEATETDPPTELDSGIESTMLPPMHHPPTAPVDLRKGTDTPKVLYKVLDESAASSQPSAVFASQVAYAMPGDGAATDGAESVLAKAAPEKRKRKDDDDDNDLKNFKF